MCTQGCQKYKYQIGDLISVKSPFLGTSLVYLVVDIFSPEIYQVFALFDSKLRAIYLANGSNSDEITLLGTVS